MPVITKINNIPLYSIQAEALAWGSRYNIQGTHTHLFRNQTGYMAGFSHRDVMKKTKSVKLGQLNSFDDEKNIAKTNNNSSAFIVNVEINGEDVIGSSYDEHTSSFDQEVVEEVKQEKENRDKELVENKIAQVLKGEVRDQELAVKELERLGIPRELYIELLDNIKQNIEKSLAENKALSDAGLDVEVKSEQEAVDEVVDVIEHDSSDRSTDDIGKSIQTEEQKRIEEQKRAEEDARAREEAARGSSGGY